MLAALPFAVWLFLAIEELPLAAEESVDPKKDMPKGLIFGMFTLIFSALMIMFLNASIGAAEEGKLHGAFSLATSAEPLLDGFRVIYGADIAKLLSLFAVIGLIASFHTIIFAYRPADLFAVARRLLSCGDVAHARRTQDAAHRALHRRRRSASRSSWPVWFSLGAEKGGAVIGATLLNMAVFGAMISYAFQGLSFILLRKNMPNIERPYRSPLGVPGAAVTVVIALVTLYFQLQDPRVSRRASTPRSPGTSAAVLYFALVGRHKLVLSPEEEFAIDAAVSMAIRSAKATARRRSDARVCACQLSRVTDRNVIPLTTRYTSD